MSLNSDKWILIVDDEENVRNSLRLTLEQSQPHYRVVTAPDSLTALGRLRQHSFDLVLTDWQMGGMDGVALARTIRDLSPHTRILLMTGGDPLKLRTMIKSLGLNGGLEKPFTATKILEVVEQVMAQTGKQSEQ